MLLANGVHTPTFHTLNVVAVGYLQRSKDCDITGLKLVRGVRGEAAEKDVVGEAML
jgi:hypothetical protein